MSVPRCLLHTVRSSWKSCLLLTVPCNVCLVAGACLNLSLWCEVGHLSFSIYSFSPTLWPVLFSGYIFIFLRLYENSLTVQYV